MTLAVTVDFVGALLLLQSQDEMRVTLEYTVGSLMVVGASVMIITMLATSRSKPVVTDATYKNRMEA